MVRKKPCHYPTLLGLLRHPEDGVFTTASIPNVLLPHRAGANLLFRGQGREQIEKTGIEDDLKPYENAVLRGKQKLGWIVDAPDVIRDFTQPPERMLGLQGLGGRNKWSTSRCAWITGARLNKVRNRNDRMTENPCWLPHVSLKKKIGKNASVPKGALRSVLSILRRTAATKNDNHSEESSLNQHYLKISPNSIAERPEMLLSRVPLWHSEEVRLDTVVREA